ncbi:hypothetical protein GDO81_024776 [Engystomops pustulosus]|uniref:Uncharacterized protein n=1 Tax=Engystomops pustulosus TaxID=76066 RepID=A0AAV6YMH6_ENGPU|nr:hypothetical protein GDO81_024776 [Engystomops pustulosus]
MKKHICAIFLWAWILQLSLTAPNDRSTLFFGSVPSRGYQICIAFYNVFIHLHVLALITLSYFSVRSCGWCHYLQLLMTFLML